MSLTQSGMTLVADLHSAYCTMDQTTLKTKLSLERGYYSYSIIFVSIPPTKIPRLISSEFNLANNLVNLVNLVNFEFFLI